MFGCLFDNTCYVARIRRKNYLYCRGINEKLNINGPITIFVLINALGWEYIKYRSFLSDFNQ